MSDEKTCEVCGRGGVDGSSVDHGWGVCGFADVMVDIETLGVKPTAAIVQLAAVRFDPWTKRISSPEGAFNFHVKMTGDPEIDGDMDASTVYWWLRQRKEAQQRVFEPVTPATSHVGIGIFAFLRWLADMPFKRVWAAGPQFDLAILKQTFERTVNRGPFLSTIGSPSEPLYSWPIRYGEERDFRTLRELGGLLGVTEPVRVGVAHDALDDCFHQAGWAIEILRAARVTNVSSAKPC